MVIVSTTTYPPESAEEMAKRFLEAPEIPDFMTRRGPYFNSNIEKGIFSLSIWELDKSKVPDGTEYLGNYMAIFFGVPGFKYEIKSFLEIQEALNLIGMG